jgi:hypothetical protein
MNCHVTKFGSSGLTINYAKDVTIEHSSFDGNLGYGIYGLNLPSDGIKDEGTIDDGIKDEGTLEMNDVSTSNNGGVGMQITGWVGGIQLNKIVANENGYEALKIDDPFVGYPLNAIQIKDVTALNNNQQVYSYAGAITAANAKMISIEKATVVGGKIGISTFLGDVVELRDISVEDTNDYGISVVNPRYRGNNNIETSMSNVRVINSGGEGIYIEVDGFGSGEVTTILEDVISKQSDGHGLEYTAAAAEGNFVLKGQNHFDDNEGLGVVFSGGATASVSHGKVTANGNQAGGISTENASFEVEKKGSVVACGNKDFDVNALGTSTFTGHNYMCEVAIGAESPQCKPCKTAKSRK